MQNPIVHPVSGIGRPEDNVVYALGDFEVVGFEDETIFKREGLGPGFGVERSKLNSAEASGLPVLALCEDFQSED